MARHVKEDKPTKESIDEAHQYLSGVWTEAHAKWKEVDSYYHRRYPLWPTGMTREVYRPSRPTNIIDHAADTQLQHIPTIHREPISDTPTHREAADDIEVAVKAIMADSALRETVLPFKQAGRHMLAYGYTVIEGPVWDTLEEPEEPKEKDFDEEDDFKDAMSLFKAKGKHWNPIRIRAPHPARVLMEPWEKIPRLAIKTMKMRAQDLRALTERKKGKRRLKDIDLFDMTGHQPYELIELQDYWTLEWHVLKLSTGQILYIEKNTWGFLTFTHAFSGFGMEPTDESIQNPSFMAQGLLDPIMDSIKIHAQGMSAKHRLLMDEAYKPRGTEGDATAYQDALATGGILQGKRDDFWILEGQKVERWMFETGREVDSDIEDGSYTRSLAGRRQSGVDTVGQQSILDNAANRKFAVVSTQLEHMGSVVASNILQLVMVLKKSIAVNGKVLKLQDIAGLTPVSVKFEVIDPQVQLQKRQIGMNEVQLRLKTRRAYMEEDRQVANISKEEQEQLRQDVRDMPLIHDLLARKAAEDEGLGAEFDEAVRIQKELQAEATKKDGNAQAVPDSRNGAPTDFQQQTVSDSRNGGNDVAFEPRAPLSDTAGKPERIDVA